MYVRPSIFATGTTILAIKMIAAMPYISLLISEATPEIIVSSNLCPFVIRIEIGITLAGTIATDAANNRAHVFCIE